MPKQEYPKYTVRTPPALSGLLYRKTIDGYLDLRTKKKREIPKTVQKKTQVRPFFRIVDMVTVKTIGAIKSTNNMIIGVLRIASFMFFLAANAPAEAC